MKVFDMSSMMESKIFRRREDIRKHQVAEKQIRARRIRSGQATEYFQEWLTFIQSERDQSVRDSKVAEAVVYQSILDKIDRDRRESEENIDAE